MLPLFKTKASVKIIGGAEAPLRPPPPSVRHCFQHTCSSLSLQPAQKKAQREPHLYSADHAVILGQANTLRATAEHHKMSSIKQGVCEGEVEYYF